MTPEFSIEGRLVGGGHRPYVIAEVSGNHNGDIGRALRLIEVAKEAGADAVKLQTYTADSLTIDTDREEFILQGGTWDGWNVYQLYEHAHTPWEWFPELFERARNVGITAFSTPFDIAAVAFLENLGVPAFKVASNELTDWPLVEAVARTGKPMVMSTGAATRQDVSDTVDFVRGLGVTDLAILHCVSAYPASPEEANIRTMKDIQESFRVVPGFSDHTLGTAASVAAVALGACIIEKHVTLSRDDGGIDSSFSLEPNELELLCREVRWAWQGLGGVVYGGDTDLETKGIFTRQFWTITEIGRGDLLHTGNIRSIRAPVNAGGVATRHYREVIGSRAGVSLQKHCPLKWEEIERS